jgi:hypothetical protein
VLRAIPNDWAIARSVAPHSYLRRRISRTRRIDTLSAGIGSPARHHRDEQRDPPAQRSSDRHPEGGRLHIGMAEIKSESVADFIPESMAGLLRNQQSRNAPRQHAPRRGRAASNSAAGLENLKNAELGRQKTPEARHTKAASRTADLIPDRRSLACGRRHPGGRDHKRILTPFRWIFCTPTAVFFSDFRHRAD